MRTLTFGYSKLYISLTTFFILIAAIMFIAIGFLLSNTTQWLIFISVGVVAFAVSRFFILNFVVPASKNKPALTLDEEKLVSYVSDETLYWKNVVKISKSWGSTYAYFVFEMNDGEFVQIGTKWVEGTEDFIFNNIQDFYNAAQKSQ
jgi:hypothetical protein